MKLWIDDARPAPEGYVHCLSVDETIKTLEWYETVKCPIELLDIDHDAGKYAPYGGDYIRILDWLEETGRNYPIHIHSINPVDVENMRQIIQRNGWKEV